MHKHIKGDSGACLAEGIIDRENLSLLRNYSIVCDQNIGRNMGSRDRSDEFSEMRSTVLEPEVKAASMQ